MGTPTLLGDPFAGITNSTPGELVKADEKLKIAIIGKVKTGKSWMAATAPGPVMYYDFDGRAASLAGKTGIRIKTLVDANQNAPTAIKALEGDLDIFKYAKINGKPIPTSFVFDSVTYMKKAMENELFQQQPTLARSIKLSPVKSFKIGADWDVINGVRAYLEYIFNEFTQLGTVVYVFHQRDEKDDSKSTKTQKAFTGRQTVDPQYLATLLALFNEQFFIEVNPYTKAYEVTCKPTADFGAATTLLIGEKEPPSISDMLNKHRANLAKKQGTAT